MTDIICLQSLLLLIWFHTDAFIEYFKYIPKDIFKIKSFLTAKNNDVTLTYQTYLLYNHNCFLTRLITCPICFNVWLSIILCLMSLNLLFVPVVCISSLIIYYLLVKLM